MQNTNIEPTEEQEDIVTVNNYEGRALALVINSNEDAQFAADHSNELAKRIDMVKVVYKDLCAPAKLMVENAKKYCDPALNDYENARRITKEKLAEWDVREKNRLEAERLAKEEEERKIRQEAEKKAALIQAKADAKIEAERKKVAEAAAREAEAKKKGDAAAAQAAAMDKAKAEQKAKRAEENADAKATEIHTEAAAQISAQDPVEEKVKISGSAMRDKWGAELVPGTDIDKARMEIIKAAASDSPELAALLTVDMKQINKLASALKKSMSVPGFAAVNRPIAVGSRK